MIGLLPILLAGALAQPQASPSPLASAALLPIEDPQWLRNPSRPLELVYPPAARKREIEGKAVVQCMVKTDGTMKECSVTEETPPDVGFGKAALRFASQLRMRPVTTSGEPVAGRPIVIPISFRLGNSSSSQTTNSPRSSVIVNPDWKRKPATADILKAYPPEAFKAQLEGRAVVKCTILASGRTDACQIDEETPVGAGFGEAALKIAAMFEFYPQTVNGVPVGGATIKVPIRFGMDRPTPTSPSPSPAPAPPANSANDSPKPALIEAPRWILKPSGTDIARVYPPAAIRAEMSGRVRLRCLVKDDGTLRDCSVIEETPPAFGFSQAALALVPRFRMTTETGDGRPVGGATIVIPIVFRLE